jgi:hypothetical protein
MIHDSGEHFYAAQESNGGKLYTTTAVRLELRMVILGLCVAARMETHFYEAPDEKLLC